MKRKLALACMVSALPVVGLMLVDLAAHEDKQTLIAADATNDRGVVTYRVTLRGGGFWPDETYPTETQIRAQLLAPGNKHLGNWRMTIYWRKVWDPQMKQEPSMTLGGWKNHAIGQEHQLEWNGQTIKVEQMTEEKTATVWFNGKQILSATNIDIKSKKSDSQMDTAALTQAKDLFQLIGDVEKDLRAAMARPQPLTSCCGPGGSGEVVCSGGYTYGSGSGLTRQSAQVAALQDTNLHCWNSYCTGCCQILSCQVYCISDVLPPLAGLLCSGNCSGQMCACKPGYIALPAPPKRSDLLKAND